MPYTNDDLKRGQDCIRGLSDVHAVLITVGDFKALLARLEAAEKLLVENHRDLCPCVGCRKLELCLAQGVREMKRRVCSIILDCEDKKTKSKTLTDIYGPWICISCGRVWEGDTHRCKAAEK